MRTTVTLDTDVMQEIRRIMRERGVGFKETINDLIRRGLRAQDAAAPYTLPTFSSGVNPGIDLDRALSAAAALEDTETIRKFEMGK